MATALSGWFIDDIELPEAPNFDDRVINRTFQSETLFNFFAELTKSTARASDYTIKGVIYPKNKAFQLDQIASSADTNTVVLTVPFLEGIGFVASKFAVKTLKLTRKGPLFINFDFGGGVKLDIDVIPFELTLTQLADEGETTEGVDGFQEGEEGSLGLEPLYELVHIFAPVGGGNTLILQDYGPFELFQNPQLGDVDSIPGVEAEI